MNIERLRALHAVAQHGSVNAAAGALHLTTSAVSQQLGKLERDVGQPLLERRGRGVRLTDAAVVLADHAGRILSQVEAAKADMEAHRDRVVGHLTLAAFPSAARGVAAGALRTLRDRYADLAVELREMEMDESIPMVLRGDVDIALVNEWGAEELRLPPSATRLVLAHDVFDLVLPASHPLADRPWVDLVELAGQEWIAWTKDSICYDWLVQTMRSKDLEPVIAHTAEEHPTQMALVAAGLGAAILPRLGRTAATDGVAFVGLRPQLTRHIYAVWRTDATARPSLRAVTDALLDAAADHRCEVSGRTSP